MPKPPPDKDRIARIISDAKVYGDADTCKRHKISRKTLTRYRKMSAGDPVVSNKVAELQKPVLAEAQTHYVSWLAKAAATRERLLGRVESLAILSDDLHAVAGAYKIVNDGILADRAVGSLDPEGDDDGGRTGASSGVADPGGHAETVTRGALQKLAH